MRDIVIVSASCIKRLNMNSSESKRSIKLVVVGDGACGKTSLLLAFKVRKTDEVLHNFVCAVVWV